MYKVFFDLQKKIQDLSINNAYASDIAALKNVYNTLLKRKQDISNEINTLKYKGKMFPPIVKQQCTIVKQDHSIDDQFFATPSVQEESEESWTIDEEEEESYNMEFNVEQKLPSKQSPKTKKCL